MARSAQASDAGLSPFDCTANVHEIERFKKVEIFRITSAANEMAMNGRIRVKGCSTDVTMQLVSLGEVVVKAL